MKPEKDFEQKKTEDKNTTEKQLLGELMKSMHRFKKEKMETLFIDEVSQAEFFLLHVITSHGKDPERGIYVSKLASRLKVSPPAVSRMLKSLEERDLIYRVIDTQSRRNTMVFLTEKGKKALKDCENILNDFGSQVIRKMGIDDVKEMIRLWVRFGDIMEEEIEILRSK